MNQAIRVMQLASGDLWAGAEVQLYTLCCELLKRNDIKLKVVLLNYGELERRLKAKNIEVMVVDESKMGFFSIVYSVLSSCYRLKPNIIHSHGYKVNLIAGVCRLFACVPSIRTAHGASEFTVDRFSISGLLQEVDMLIGRKIQSKVVAVSEDLKGILLPEFGRSKLEVIRNGVNVERTEGDYINPFNTQAFNIGIVGRLTPVKRVDIFLQMVVALKEQSFSKVLRFYVLGDGPLKEELNVKCLSLGIDDQVQFLGQVPSAIEYIKGLDVLVMCSDHEGTPMTLLEALSVETPIVAHDVGGLRELLNGGACGVLVSEHTASAYAEKVKMLLDHPKQTVELIHNGKNFLNEHYTAERNAASYVKLYQTWSQ